MTFIEFYNSVLNTSHSSNDELPFPVKKMCFDKGEVITSYGQIEKQVCFMNHGIVEMTIKSYVSEKIIDFFFENEMFCAMTSFLTQIPADVQITALTDCEVEILNRKELFIAYDHSLHTNKFGRILTEHGYIRKSNREKDFLSKTAEERYTEMIASHSKYINLIPVNKVAKYLGIHPESLSRIRSKMIS